MFENAEFCTVLDRSEAVKIDKFTAFDGGTRSGPRQIRPTALSGFRCEVVTEVDGEEVSRSYDAYVVACGVPVERSDQMAHGDPIAIAEIDHVGEIKYLLITASKCVARATDRGSSDAGMGLEISGKMIRFDGDPEYLLEHPEEFEIQE